jgi:serine/threonine-protein kinase
MTDEKREDLGSAPTIHAAASLERRAEDWTQGALAVLNKPGAATGGGVELGDVIGEGGMGVVHAAVQRSLGRDVAVKTLRRDQQMQEPAVNGLLREALVTGSLEHPNIVPVYDVGLDGRGAPLLVLKRISGISWHDLLADPSAVTRRFGASDALEWHLRTFMQVCSAIHFAHRRGIIHRDIKPANVMLGEFGEVYVLDWGIAVALTDDGSDRFPLASEAIGLAGTPKYMAPEMFLGDPADQRTDVYLLGATLYELVAGEPPHRGTTYSAILAELREPPPCPESAPAELSGIWCRAMSVVRDDRFATAEDLRLAVQGFLDHRGSTRLASGAAAAFAELKRELASADPAQPKARETLYNHFGECQFGFRQALEEWPENEVARHGLHDAIVRMANYEIDNADHRAARLLLAKLEPPDEALVERVAALERHALRSAERVEALERLGREMDPNAGRRGRAVLLVVLAFLWVAVPLVVSRFDAANPDYASLFPVPALMFVVVVVGAILTRRSMVQSSMNRAIVGASALAFFGQMAVHVGSWLAKVPPDESQRLVLLVWFFIAATMAIAVLPRLGIAAAGYLLAYFATSRWFGFRYEIMSASNAVLCATILLTFTGRTKMARSGGITSLPPP